MVTVKEREAAALKRIRDRNRPLEDAVRLVIKAQSSIQTLEDKIAELRLGVKGSVELMRSRGLSVIEIADMTGLTSSAVDAILKTKTRVVEATDVMPDHSVAGMRTHEEGWVNHESSRAELNSGAI